MPGIIGWLRLLGPDGSPDMRYRVYSPAWAQIWPPSSDVSTICPRPVWALAYNAASMPASRFWPEMWSATVAPTGLGSLPLPPVVLMSPPAACALRSAPSRAASGPCCPNEEPTA